MMVQQLFPASARFGEGVANIIESHVLERNKYQNKFPLLTRYPSTEGQVRGVNERTYNWKFGHSPEYKDRYYNQRAIEILMAADYLTLPVDASLNAGTNEAFSFGCWIYFDSSIADPAIVFKFGNERQIVYDKSDQSIDVKIKFASTLHTWTGPHSSFATDAWHHLVITYDGGTSNTSVKTYKNGAALASMALGTSPSAPAVEISTTSNIGFELIGKLDEVNYWSAAIDASGVGEIYASGQPFDLRTHSDAGSLVSYWRMGDHHDDPEDAVYKGSVIRDSKGSNDLTGFINNAAGKVIEYVAPAANGALLRGQITNQHCDWQKQRRERTDAPKLNNIRDVITGQTSGSVPMLAKDDRTSFQGSTFATRRFARPYRLSVALEKVIHGGVNFDGQRNKDLALNAVHIHGPVVSDGSAADGAPRNLLGVGIGQGKGIAPIIDCEDVRDPNAKEKFNLEVIIGRNSDDAGNQPLSQIVGFEYKVKGELILPFNVMSGNISSGYNAEVFNGFDRDAVLTNLHSDVTTMNNDIPMQGPFTEGWVGGHQSRHAELNDGQDTITTRGEGFRVVFNEHSSEAIRDGAIGLTGPDYGANYPDVDRAMAVHYRGNRAKRPLNIENIQYNTGSRRHGNYKENYEIISTAGRKENNFALRDYIGDLLPSPLVNELPATTHVSTLIAKGAVTSSNGNFFGRYPDTSARHLETYDFEPLYAQNTGSNSVIVNRFSAPGGPEINSFAYLDVASGEYSVHNALPFRNLSVRSSGSGEATSIRVDDHLGMRRGQKELLRGHSGQFGHDSTFGSVVSTSYVTNPSFHKINRNRLRRIELTSTGTASFGTGSVYNNGYVTSPIPASEFSYAWIDNIVEKEATYASPAPATTIFQHFLGYAPRSGIISSSSGFDSAMTFPSSSQLYGTEV